MSSDDVAIRPVRENDLEAVLQRWDAGGVIPLSVTDSIEGLTRLTHEPGAIRLLVGQGERKLKK